MLHKICRMACERWCGERCKACALGDHCNMPWLAKQARASVAFHAHVVFGGVVHPSRVHMGHTLLPPPVRKDDQPARGCQRLLPTICIESWPPNDVLCAHRVEGDRPAPAATTTTAHPI